MGILLPVVKQIFVVQTKAIKFCQAPTKCRTVSPLHHGTSSLLWLFAVFALVHNAPGLKRCRRTL